jgi:hypothetical protein
LHRRRRPEILGLRQRRGSRLDGSRATYGNMTENRRDLTMWSNGVPLLGRRRPLPPIENAPRHREESEPE